MTHVGCWLSECKWCENGWCNKEMITIDEDRECEDFVHFRAEYKHEYWIACYNDGKRFRRLIKRGYKIEYKGYIFYTEDKIDEYGTYRLTEERTGYSIGEFRTLESRWEKFLEIYPTIPDVMSYDTEENMKSTEL